MFTSAAPATAPSGVQGTLPNPPPEVSQLPTGTTLRGVVQGHDNKGHLLVRTDLGTLAVSTKAHLPPGSEVVLQIRSSGAQLHVLLMHSDAPGSGAAAQRSIPPGPNPPASTHPIPHSPGALSPDQLTLGQTVRAILQSPALLPTATGSVGLAGAGTLDPAIVATVIRLAPGSQIILRILAIDAPTGAPPGIAPLATGTGTAQAVSPGASPGATPGSITSQGPAAQSPVPGQAGVLPAANPVATQPGLPGANAPLAGAAAAQSTPGPTGVPGSAGPAAGPVPPGGGTPSAGPSSAGSPAATAGVTSAQAPISTPPSATSPAGPLPTALPAGAGAAYGSAAQATTGPYSGTPGPGGAPLQVTGAGTTAQAGPTPSLAASSAGSQITGVVTATTNAGHPVLQTPVGTLTLEVQAPIPTGSRVVFELIPSALPRDTTNLPASLARAWPEVEEAVRVLQEATPPGATPAAAIPQPGSRLASGLLFFLAALSGGDMSRWLGGQAVQALKTAGRDGLIARLGQDFAQLSRHVESGGADWRLFLIPLLDGSQVQQIRFFERHGSHGRGTGDDQREGESTRFILEVELSRVGDMQIDGLVRGKRFDLMLRTRRPLPDVMRHDITGIFSDANDAAGFIGSIGFQASRDWRFMPIDSGVTTTADAGLVI